MLVIPAIDISEGRCVRLRQGDMAQKTVFSDDPAAMARRWSEAGAEVLHVVDLDGATTGGPASLEAVAAIVGAIDIPVELGGGLRTAKDVARVLDLGVRWAIVGTSAIADPDELTRCLDRFGDQIIVGIDARDGRVAVEGWTRTSDVAAADLARKVTDLGVATLIFTDIATDGMLSGPNLDSTRSIAEQVSVPVIHSGGITSLDDIRRAATLEDVGVVGCIVGRALYTGDIDLAQAIGLTAGS